jgi:hypothetical protein
MIKLQLAGQKLNKTDATLQRHDTVTLLLMLPRVIHVAKGTVALAATSVWRNRNAFRIIMHHRLGIHLFDHLHDRLLGDDRVFGSGVPGNIAGSIRRIVAMFAIEHHGRLII